MQARLINTLLDYSRIAANKFSLSTSLISLASIVSHAIEDFKPMARAKRIEIEVDLPTSENQIVGDSLRLSQVLSNLLSNAVKFTARGGNIKVKLETVDGYHRIIVSDTGEGISPEFLPFVFDRYRQAHRWGANADGLGLGLTIAQHIIELHRGTIEAYSQGKGRGAVFTVQLPHKLST